MDKVADDREAEDLIALVFQEDPERDPWDSFSVRTLGPESMGYDDGHRERVRADFHRLIEFAATQADRSFETARFWERLADRSARMSKADSDLAGSQLRTAVLRHERDAALFFCLSKVQLEQFPPAKV